MTDALLFLDDDMEIAVVVLAVEPHTLAAAPRGAGDPAAQWAAGVAARATPLRPTAPLPSANCPTPIGAAPAAAGTPAGRAAAARPAGGPSSLLPPPASPVAGLSRRELEVLRLIVDGHRDHEIAERLSTSERTVHSQVAGILTKLGVRSRTAAAVYAVRHGLA